MAEFEIKVAELDAGAREYDFPIRASWLVEGLSDLAPEDHAIATSDGTLHVIAEKSAGDVLVRGEADATLYVPCGRCLSPAEIHTRPTLTLLLTRRGDAVRPVGRPVDEAEEAEPETLEGGPDIEIFSGDEIRLDDLVREHLVLEIPMQPLCRPDCPGIEVPESIRGPKHLDAHPRAPDLDPRLAPLLALSKDKKASS